MIETLVILALTGCAPDGTEVLCRFPAPENLAQRQVRLAVACLHEVHLNGSTVEGGTRVRVVRDFLIGRGANALRMKANCEPAKLLVTPRVYIAGILPESNGLAISVENGLENTVSVGVTCRGRADSGSSSATIPANGQAQLAIAVRAEGRITCILEKAPEALEESYRYQIDALFQ